MNNEKVAFIICTNNMQYYEECVRYIQDLEVPDGYSTDILCIQEAESMAEGYNGGMQASDAKYKVYLHQDTFILNRNFIYDIVRIFTKDENIGMIGVLGVDKLPADANCYLNWNVGRIAAYDGRAVFAKPFTQKQEEEWIKVQAVDGLIMVTQYDIPWRGDIFDGWDFYDVSQALEMKRQGYQVVVPYQETPWCYHHCGCSKLKKYDFYREKAVFEYPEIFSVGIDWQEAEQKKRYQEEAEAVSKELLRLLVCHQYTQLNEIAEKMRGKWLLNTEIREVMNLMEIYSLEEASISGIHSEWFALKDWNQIREYYNWVRFAVLRIEYEREDERAKELREMVKSGRVSRDAIRKISAVNLADSWNVYPYLLKEEKEEPLVSVVIATYHGENVLGAAIESVLNQTYRNLEVIVVDDASTDSTREKILTYQDARIKPVFLEKNRHTCYAGNVGLKKAAGKYIALMGHDDVWRADKLEKQVSFLEEHPSYGLCLTWTNIIDEQTHIANAANNKLYQAFNADNLSAERWSRKLVLDGNLFCAPSACIRSTVLRKTGYYRYGLVQLQDYDLWLRTLSECEVYILQERETYYRKFSQKGKNLSDENTETLARDMHEKEWIYDTFVRNLPEERFAHIFKADMKHADAHSEKQILCEKAFFLWNMGNCFAEKWFIELLEDAECREILEREYQFELKDFYKMNTEPMLFDNTLAEIVSRQQQIIRAYQEKEKIQ